MNLTQEELDLIRDMNNRFTKAKISLGDIELTKYELMKEVDKLKIEFEANEKALIEKYGADAVINVKTGEVTLKNK